MSSENWNLASGKHYEIDGTDVLTSTTLGSGVVNSSLTNVGTLTELNVNGIATATTFVGALTGTATTATNLAGGDTGDIPYQSAANTTTFGDASTASTGQVLLWSGTAPTWSPVALLLVIFGGITLQNNDSTVGTAGSVGGINFKGNNVTASSSGVVIGIVTISDTPTFDSLNVTGISTIPTISGDVAVGTGITLYASSGIISATAFYGNGENLTDLVNQKIDGLQILDEGTPVGTGYSFAALNFIGNGVSVAAVGLGTTANITIKGFGSDADENLFAGTCAGGTYDPSTGSACFNIFIGSCTGKSIGEGDNNVFLGRSAGCSNVDGSQNNYIGNGAGSNVCNGSFNNFIGQAAGGGTTSGSGNNFIGRYAGCYSGGTDNTIVGSYAGIAHTTGSNNIMIGNLAWCLVMLRVLESMDKKIFSLDIVQVNVLMVMVVLIILLVLMQDLRTPVDLIITLLVLMQDLAIPLEVVISFWVIMQDNVIPVEIVTFTSDVRQVNVATQSTGCQNIFLGSRAGYGNTSGYITILFLDLMRLDV